MRKQGFEHDKISGYEVMQKVQFMLCCIIQSIISIGVLSTLVFSMNKTKLA